MIRRIPLYVLVMLAAATLGAGAGLGYFFKDDAPYYRVSDDDIKTLAQKTEGFDQLDERLIYEARDVARRCVDDRCRGEWELWGSQDYYSVPRQATVMSKSHVLYTVVVTREFHVTGRPVEFEPHYAIYAKFPSGLQVRRGADGSVSRLIDGEWKSDPEGQAFGQHIKEEAILAFTTFP